jgi:hypothetical protein
MPPDFGAVLAAINISLAASKIASLSPFLLSITGGLKFITHTK